MKVRQLAGVWAVAFAVGCSSSTSAPAPFDGGAAGTTGDAAVDHVTPTDAAPGTTTQELAETILVTDQIGGDGGLDAAVEDAGTADAGGIAVDPHLVNPWGLAIDTAGPLWVANNGTGLATVYGPTGQVMSLVVTVPVGDGGAPPSRPTGLVFNASAAAFMGDTFIFSTEEGTISGWQAGTTAALRVDSSATGANYKGLGLATVTGVGRLFATDFHNGKVDVFDQTYAKVTTAGGFTDPTLPAGYAPFGVQVIGASVYVTYALQDAGKTLEVVGAGNGYVDAFNVDGHLSHRVASQGGLNAPWGVALAPADFGAFSNALLVGNFGDGHINAYTPAGTFLGPALTTTGATLAIDGLWSLVFGNGTADEAADRLFFTAGPGLGAHGRLGHLDLP